MRLIRDEAGYSLIEMLVVLVILGIVLGGLTTIFVSGTHAEMDMNLRFQAQQNGRLALSRLRSDLHLGGCVNDSTPTAGSPLGSLNVYPSPATAGACTGSANETWCTAASTALTGRWALYREAGGTCDSTNGVLVADYLTTSTPFTTQQPSLSGQRTRVAVSIPVSTNKTNPKLDLYTLNDSIVLRNAPQLP